MSSRNFAMAQTATNAHDQTMIIQTSDGTTLAVDHPISSAAKEERLCHHSDVCEKRVTSSQLVNAY